MDRHTGNRVLGFSILAEVKHTGPGRVDVGVEERRDEPDLGRSGGEVILEDDLSPVQAALPHRAQLTRDPEPGTQINKEI